MSIATHISQPRRKTPQEAVLEGAAPVKNPDDATVTRGRDAWERRKADTASWDDWKLIGEALVVGRKAAMAKANKTQPSGKGYNSEFSRWLQLYGFDEIDSADRADLFKIMDTLEEIEEWRAGLTEEQQAKWNHPSTVWRVSRCKDRGLPRLRSSAEPISNGSATTSNGSATSDNGSGATTPRDDDAEWHHTKLVWQEGLFLRANKAIGDAQLHEHWLLDTPPDPLLLEQVRRAADEWSITADYLEEIANDTPEQLKERRDGHVRTKELRKALKEKKEAKEQASVGAA